MPDYSYKVIIINKGVRDGSWLPDAQSRLTMFARELLQIILEGVPQTRSEVTAGELTEVLTRAGIPEWTDDLADGLRELLGLGCIRVVRRRGTRPAEAQAA